MSISTPSPLAQALLPMLFTRDASGNLIQFDARPFSGRGEITRQLSASLHLSNPYGPLPMANGDRPGTKPAPLPLTWDVNLVYTRMLDHRLRLAGRAEPVDLLSNPLSLSSPEPRHQISVQWTVAKANYGLNGSLSWTSGARAEAITSDTPGETRFRAVTRINLEGFLRFGRSKDDADPSSFRIKLAVDNILNQRTQVIAVRQLDSSLQRLLNDPYGRTIRLIIRNAV